MELMCNIVTPNSSSWVSTKRWHSPSRVLMAMQKKPNIQSPKGNMWKGLVTVASMVKFVTAVVTRGWSGGDGREDELLKYVMDHSECGNPKSVLDAIDQFAMTGTWFMNIGVEKGEILQSAIRKRDPLLVLELGTYCGYSAVKMASMMREDGKIVTLELVPHIADIARKIIDHAGLSSKIEVLLAPLENRITDLREILAKYSKKNFDFVFIDHDKDLYLPDYLKLKENELINEGSVIFADNLGFPGSPKYWSYLQSHPRELASEIHKANVEYIRWIPDTVAVSTFHKV